MSNEPTYVFDAPFLYDELINFLKSVNYHFGETIDIAENSTNYKKFIFFIEVLLDTLTIDIFRRFRDNWEVDVIDYLTDYRFPIDEVEEIERSKYFKRLFNEATYYLLDNIDDDDSLYAMWDIYVNSDYDLLEIKKIGDHRIKAWHRANNVSEEFGKNSIKLDISSIQNPLLELSIGDQYELINSLTEDIIAYIASDELSKYYHSFEKTFNRSVRLGYLDYKEKMFDYLLDICEENLDRKIKQTLHGRRLSSVSSDGDVCTIKFANRNVAIKDYIDYDQHTEV